MSSLMTFTQREPLTEQEALDYVQSLGYHSLAFDDSHEVDEELHWHEFDSVAIVISGSDVRSTANNEIASSQRWQPIVL